MIAKTKTVYYCEFCRARRLVRSAMEKHESHCTRNPDRVCRWFLLDFYTRVPYGVDRNRHTMRRGLPRWVRMFHPLDEKALNKLRDHARGCPACILAAILQSGVDRMSLTAAFVHWEYDEEVKRYRDDERAHWQHEERREIEATFL